MLAAYDLETALIQPGLAGPPVVCGSVADDTGAHLLDRPQAIGWLREALADPAAHVVGCNIVYDLGCACAADPSLVRPVFDALDAGRVHDIGVREALIDIGKGDLVERGDDGEIGQRYSLALLADRYLGLDLKAEKKSPDAWRKRYAELDGVPLESWPWAARVYPMRDVAFPLEVYRLQEETGHPNLAREADEVRAAWALQLMTLWGIRANGERVAALRARVEAVDRASTLEFQASGILRADGTQDTKRLAELVTAAYHGAPPRTAPSSKFPHGQVATDRDTLAESGVRILERYATAGKNDKYLSTYLPILEAAVRAPWNPSFNVLVATGRVSSNAQQFPQSGGVRECWEARRGRVYCSVDFGGLELRTMSQRAINARGFSKMAEQLNSGVDVHLTAAASFMGVSYEEARAKYKAGDPLAKAFRDLGKIWNFGKGGGMGPGAMVYNARKGSKGDTTTAPDGTRYIGSRFCLLAKVTTHCGEQRTTVRVQGKERRICTACLEVAQRLDAGWLAAWPEQRQLFAQANQLAKSSRHLDVEIPGMRITRGKCGYTQWLNTPFQGLGAAAVKRAMWVVSRECYTRQESPLFGSRLVLNVHDELIAEMPEDRAPEAADRMALVMREVLKKFVPDLAASVEAEPALSRTMSKKAQTVRDAAGRLQVWEEAAR